MTLRPLLFALALLTYGGAASAAPLSIALTSSAKNPVSPQMGDHMSFHSVIRNNGTTPIDGLIAWISLVQVDRGKEQPVDLEDWSAHKAVATASLLPGKSLETDWPMRLIQSGTYRVVVSTVSRNGAGLNASPFAEFKVRPKPVVESRRVLPVAFGMPLILAGVMSWRRYK